VLSVSYSPDGTQIVSAGDDRTIRLWRGADTVCLYPTDAGGLANTVSPVKTAANATIAMGGGTIAAR
jgi:WD40 repeat protein